MSEKATLLTSIPPVKKTGTDSGRTSLLSSVPEVKKEGKVSLLSQVKPAERTSQAKELSSTTSSLKKVAPSTNQTTQGQAVETVAAEAVADESASITGFQFVTYVSFVMNFVLAGIAGVILFKKATKLVEERFVLSTKTLAIASFVIMLHGFFATFLYASHLNNSISNAPLFMTMAVWILVGPAVGFITRTLLARGDKPNRNAAYIDAGVYAGIFFLTAVGVSSGIKTNAALLSAILAGFLMIVPIARSLTAFNMAKARHKELNELSDKILIYGLLIMPALLPILAFIHVCGLSDAATLFLINFITFDFVLVVAISMMASADQFAPEAATEESATAADSTEDAPAAPQAESAQPAMAKVEEKAAPAEPAEAPKPQKIASGNPDDPIIQFLNSEGEDSEKAASPKPASKSTPRTLPPRKPGRPGVTPPKKPGKPGAAAASTEGAPNAPTRVKAPSKPKKRF